MERFNINSILNDITPLWERLQNTKKPIVLYGMGDGADRILDIASQKNIKISGIFASDEFARYNNFRGYTVKKFSDITNEFGDVCVLVAFGTHLDSVIENVNIIDLKSELYIPDLPVYGNELFDEKFLDDNYKSIEKVYNMLCDDLSKYIFVNIIKYKISGEKDYLFSAVSAPDEPYDTFFKLNDREVYLDLGAYRGDTVASFLDRVYSYKKIYAVEPDPKNFEKLVSNTSHLNNIKCFNYASSNEEKTVYFDSKKGRGSGITDKKLTPIKAIDMDSLIDDDITYIKMDVEGEEYNTILGCKRIITDLKPQMAISAYHKSSDIFSLPLLIDSFRKDYKVYLRRKKCIPAWDIDYYFV